MAKDKKKTEEIKKTKVDKAKDKKKTEEIKSLSVDLLPKLEPVQIDIKIDIPEIFPTAIEMRNKANQTEADYIKQIEDEILELIQDNVNQLRVVYKKRVPPALVKRLKDLGYTVVPLELKDLMGCEIKW